MSEASLLYDYRNSDPENGEIQALELYEQLRHVLTKGDATVHRATVDDRVLGLGSALMVLVRALTGCA